MKKPGSTHRHTYLSFSVNTPPGGKNEITIWKMLSGHFWYASFWVPDPPPPLSTDDLNQQACHKKRHEPRTTLCLAGFVQQRVAQCRVHSAWGSDATSAAWTWSVRALCAVYTVLHATRTAVGRNALSTVCCADIVQCSAYSAQCALLGATLIGLPSAGGGTTRALHPRTATAAHKQGARASLKGRPRGLGLGPANEWAALSKRFGGYPNSAPTGGAALPG